MEVELLHNTPLYVAAKAIRTAWNSHDKSDTRELYICPECGSVNLDFDIDRLYYDCEDCKALEVNPLLKTITGKRDKELIERVGNKYKHSSTLEHLVYTFNIKGISRALLQELARHRIASLTVKSTRYTIKELKNEKSFLINSENSLDDSYKRASKYIRFTENKDVNRNIMLDLENLRSLVATGVSNDIVKYLLPEAYLTELVWTINARSLQNFLNLRTDKSALPEIQTLAHKVYEALPDEHKYLFVDYVKTYEI